MKLIIKIRDVLTPHERRNAVVLFCLMLIGMILEMLGVGLVVPIVALLIQGDWSVQYPAVGSMLNSLGNPTQTQMVVGVMLILVGLYLTKNIFLAYLVWRQTKYAYNVQAKLSQRLFKNYLQQPYIFHLQRNSAELIRNVTTEASLFSSHVLIPIMLLLTESLVVVGVGGVLMVVEPIGTILVLFVVGGAGWVFYNLTRTRVNKWGKDRQFHESCRLQHLQQGLGGVKDVKLLGREAEFLLQYKEHNSKSTFAAQRQVALQQMPRLALELLAVIGLTLLVIVMAFQGSGLANVAPVLGLFAAAAFRLMPSVNRLLGVLQTLRFSQPVINTLHQELHTSTVFCSSFSQLDAKSYFRNEIVLTDVSFCYPSSFVSSVKGISIKIKKGQSVGIIGPSGSGKSTLIDLILGLLQVDEGQVVVDGLNIKENARAWQNQIGYVPQSIYLTDDTLRRNVAFGLSDDIIDDAAVHRAIQAAQLDAFVLGLSDGIETWVGERGVRLSGGQRQRIGIARALYHDPAVLVLDEATSALDTDTESGVMEAVEELHGEKTILIVAHRLSTIENCDKVYRLQDGGIVESSKESHSLV